MKKNIIYLVLVLSVLVNIFFAIKFLNQSQIGADRSAEIAEEKYPFLAKRILAENPNDILVNFSSLRRDLRSQGAEFGPDFSVYFEYLPTGTSVGVNEKVEFFPGSLLKVPTIMAYLHQKDKNNITGDPEYEIKEEQFDQRFGSLWQRGTGAKVKESEAIRLGLTQSDNTAVNVLHDLTEKESFDYVYEGLDIILNLEETTGQPYISVKEYGSILKALYFASIVNRDDSQKILKYLTESEFNDKLPAGLPDGVPVAHKIGVYQSLETPIYSNCGIVYIPKRQYLLCMASRSDEETARERMRAVSKTVYEYVSTMKSPM